MLALILLCLRQHLRDVHAIGDVLIADEAQLRRAADDDALAQRPADVARGALEGPEEILPLVVLQDADVDLGIAQVAGERMASSSSVTSARVTEKVPVTRGSFSSSRMMRSTSRRTSSEILSIL